MAEPRESKGSAEVEGAGGSQGLMSWIGGVFVDPRSTFESIAGHTALPHPTDPNRTVDRTRWWIPLIIVGIVAVLVTIFAVVPFLAGPQQAEAIRAAVEERGGSAADAQQAIEMARAFLMPFAILGALLQVAVGLFLTAGIIHLVMKLARAEGTFRHARAVAAYSMLISALGSVIKFPLMMARKTIFVETGATLLFPDLEPSSKVYGFLFSGLDIFMIWWVFVVIVGVAAAYRVSRAKAAAGPIVIWLIMALIGMFTQGGG